MFASTQALAAFDATCGELSRQVASCTTKQKEIGKMENDYSVPCRARNCQAIVGEPCRDYTRKRKYMHIYRIRDLYHVHLERRREYREWYLKAWFQTFGDIFQEENKKDKR